MFILGFHFPADEGNKIDSKEVIAKLDEVAKGELEGVKEIKIFEGSNKNEKVELWKTYKNTDTLLGKALVNYFNHENEGKDPKYLVYTNKYQMAQLAKEYDKDDAETMEICRKFDGMEPMTIDVVYS